MPNSAKRIAFYTGLALAAGVASAARGAVLFQYTFEGAAATNLSPVVNGTTGITQSDLPAVAPEVSNITGPTALTAHHANPSKYNVGSGNGTAQAFYSTAWAQNDYDQVASNLTGYTAFTLSLDVSGSNTGPGTFKVQYTTDGSSYVDFGTLTMPTSGGSAVGFSSTTANPATHFDVPLPADVSDVQGFRIVDTAATTGGSVNGGNVGSTGTNRVDNLTVTGTATSAATPEPASAVALAGLGGLVLARRRRSR